MKTNPDDPASAPNDSRLDLSKRDLVAALEAIAELENDGERQVFKLTRFQAAQVARAALNKARSS